MNRQAYLAGFVETCSSKGISPDALVKKAQQAGLASGALSSLLEQPMLRDAASTYTASKVGKLAELLKMLKLLEVGGEQAAPAIR